MTDIDLPLFRWKPPEFKIIAFPQNKRIGKIRDVARKWLAKGSEKQAQGYVNKINRDLHRQFESLGFNEADRTSLIARFWQEVNNEVCRVRMLSQHSKKPGGAA